MRSLTYSLIFLVMFCWASKGQTTSTNGPVTTNAPSKFRSPDDGAFDISGFLDERYGFVPLLAPITEPAVGYGAVVGLSFISQPSTEIRPGFGRPNILTVGAMATENGSKGLAAGDVRQWFDDRLQTIVAAAYASVNLDFYGLGENPQLHSNPLRYNLEPRGGMVQGKYRLGNSPVWVGLNYAFAATQVSFDAPAGTPGLPGFRRDSNVGGLTPSLTYDTRDNIFTPKGGTFIEADAGLFSSALGGDDEFQRVNLTAMHFIRLHPKLTLGLRGDAAASFGNEPFYLRPYISLRGAPIMRYQGEEVAQFEAELRWQFWKRYSLVGFGGGGTAWNHFDRLESVQKVGTGGVGIRYELARKYGIHVGLDVAFGPNNTAVYIQVGSAWARP